MTILTVTNLSHGFGGREILKDVNFRLLKGEHVGLIGANGEGKSSFMNIVTGILLISHDPDFYNSLATEIWNCESWTLKIV